MDGNMPVANETLNIVDKGKHREQIKLDHSKPGKSSGPGTQPAADC